MQPALRRQHLPVEGQGVAVARREVVQAEAVVVAIRPDELERLEPAELQALARLGFDLSGATPDGGIVGIGAPGSEPGEALQREGTADLLLELGEPTARRVRLRGLELR